MSGCNVYCVHGRNPDVFVLHLRLKQRGWNRVKKQPGLLHYIKSVNRAATVTEACDFAVRAISRNTPYTNPSVFILSEDGETLELVAWTGFEPQTHSIPKNSSLSWRSIRKGHHHIIEDITLCPDYVPGMPEACCELNFPIIGVEGPLGVFSIESRACGVFTEDDVENVSLLAAVLASTLMHLITRDRLAKSLQREETRSRYRKLILDLDKSLFETRSMEEAVETFLDAVQEAFRFDKLYLFLRRGPGGPLCLQSNRGKEVPSESVAAVLEQGRGLVGKAIRSLNEVWCNDVTLDPDYYMDDAETLSELAVPVLSGETLWGVLVVDEYHRDAFSDEDVDLIRVTCNQLAVALESIHSYEAASSDLALMRTLHDVVAQVACETSIEGMCRRTVDLLRENTRYTVSEIDEVLDESTGEVRIVAASWTEDAERLREQTETLRLSGGGLVGETAREKKMLNIADVTTQPGYVSLAARTFSELDIPIIFGGRVYGVISVESDKLDAFSESDEKAFAILAGHLGVHWAHIRLLEQTSQQALQDPLTGLCNRRCITQTLEREINRCLRYNCSFCLAVVDLNDFKSVNDRYGHPEGDRVLMEFSEFFRNDLRSSDMLGRWGGDEFLVIFPETPARKARGLLDRVRTELTGKTFGQNRVAVGMDFGIAAFPNEGNTCEELVETADARLYEAKRSAENIYMRGSKTDEHP